MAEKDTIFWDVDTQFDFLKPEGRLYVPGAAKIIEPISRTRVFALENGYSIIASMDWHSLEDEEISTTPDFKETFPPHCMAFESGSERLGYLGDVPIESVGVEKMARRELAKLVEKEQYHVVIRTSSVDVFENSNTVALLELVRPRRVVVFGVALDVCVYHTVRGLHRWGAGEIIVLRDVVQGLGITKEEDVFGEFERMGVRVAILDEVKREL
ncbi:MAG: isochorismatase family protein [Planctomycetota bacterium]|jgi:nicotinamidase/pyrazinamidase